MGIQQMLLAGGETYSVNAQAMNSSAISLSPSHATSRLSIDAAGAVTHLGTGTDFQLVTKGAVADLEIFITMTGDTPTGSAVGSWVAMGGALSWTLATTGAGSLDAVGTYSVRVIATGQVLGGSTFHLHSEETI